MVGFTKASQEINVMVESIPWANEYPEWLVRFIGISEVLGGLGLIIPTALRWRPRLTITASRALILVMILAAAFHAYRGEFEMIGMNVIISAALYFIAWGRSKKAIISAR